MRFLTTFRCSDERFLGSCSACVHYREAIISLLEFMATHKSTESAARICLS